MLETEIRPEGFEIELWVINPDSSRIAAKELGITVDADLEALISNLEQTCDSPGGCELRR
jgi:hypothetical protein